MERVPPVGLDASAKNPKDIDILNIGKIVGVAVDTNLTSIRFIETIHNAC